MLNPRKPQCPSYYATYTVVCDFGSSSWQPSAFSYLLSMTSHPMWHPAQPKWYMVGTVYRKYIQWTVCVLNIYCINMCTHFHTIEGEQLNSLKYCWSIKQHFSENLSVQKGLMILILASDFSKVTWNRRKIFSRLQNNFTVFGSTATHIKKVRCKYLVIRRFYLRGGRSCKLYILVIYFFFAKV